MDRREAIGRAAVELVAEGGTHALTHRRIDQRLGLPPGTTSNYARTRRDLVRLVIQRVADVAHLREADLPLPYDVDEAVPQLVTALEQTIARGSDTRARMALSLDNVNDPELHDLLTEQSPVRTKLLADAERIFTSLGVPDPGARAIDFIGVMNGLLYDRLAGNGVRGTRVDAGAVLRAWLIGIGARTSRTDS
ncbi:TetR/AcrR family transcriptional regulator [Propionibacteriaceae bacterium Y1685]|uniref:TetR/AcrR family transcriptional regulator n=1 Tax=Microlunatus sp. Y1700 TaxID=3418487 RepID=UPI003B7C6645